MTIQDRFWSKVYDTQPETCWLWVGGSTPAGYGVIWYKTRQVYAHRLSYEWAYGPIPKGLQVDHLCFTPSCINPEHLETVTDSENKRRALNFRGQRTYCYNGHLTAESGVYIAPSGARECRVCARKRWKKYRDKKREVTVDTQPGV